MVLGQEPLGVPIRLVRFPDRLAWKNVVEFGFEIGSRFERLTSRLGYQIAEVCGTVGQHQPHIGEFFRGRCPFDRIADVIEQSRNLTELYFTCHIFRYV